MPHNTCPKKILLSDFLTIFINEEITKIRRSLFGDKKLLWPFCIPLSTSQCKIIINFLNTLLRIKSLVETVEHSQVFPWHLILPHSLGLNGLYTYLDISVFYYSGLMILWFQFYPNTFLYETCVVKLFMFFLVPAFIYYHGFRNKIKVLKR